MWTLVVVVIGPIGDAGSGVIEAEEQGFVEQLISHPAVKTLAEGVLHGFSRRDEVPGNVVFFGPGQHGVGGELSSIVRDDHSRLAARFDQRGQFASRDRSVSPPGTPG